MSKFKGYAQVSGFKNIQLPDTTKKLRAEGERTIRRMERNFKIEQENTRAVMDALNDKYRVEEQNRQFVFDLESENREQIRSRMVENDAILRANETQRIKQTQAKFDALASLSSTAQKLSVDLTNQLSAAGTEEGERLANTIALAGGSYADIEYIRDIDAAHIANDEKFQAIVKRLQANGAPNDLVDQIRNANSSKVYALNKGLLVNAGLDYPEELLRLETQQLQLADGTLSEFSLGQARQMGQFKDLVEAQELRNRSNYLAQFSGKDDDPMVARYLYPKLIEAERANSRARSAERLQRTRNEDKLAYEESIRDRFFDANGHQQNIFFIQTSENHRTARQDVLKVYAQMVKDGAWGSTEQAWDRLDDLLNTPISIDGGKSIKKFGELYGKDSGIADIRSAIYARDGVLKGRIKQQEQAIKAEREQEIITFVLENYGSGGFDDGYMKQLLALAEEEKIPTDSLKHFLSHNSSDAILRKENIAMLEEEKRNRTLDLGDFDGIVDPLIFEQFAADIEALKAEQDLMPRSKEDVRKGFRDELMIQLGKNDYEKVKGFSFSRALSEAMQLYHQQLGAVDPLTDPAARQQKAEDYVLGLIRDSDNKESPFHVTDRSKAKGNSFFSRFNPGDDNTLYNKLESGRAPAEILDEIAQDPDFVMKEAIITKTMAQDLARKIKTGQPFVIPQIYHQLADASNIPVHEIITKQLRLNTISDVTASPDLIQNIKSRVTSPELLQLIRRPTAANINTVAIASGNQVPFVRKGDDGFVDVQSLGRSLNFRSPDVMAAIWALETGRGRTVHGKNALFNVKSLDGTGTTTTTTEYDADGNPYKTTATWRNFDTPAQAAQDFIDTISKYPGVNESKTPREMVMAIAAGGYATDPNYAEKVLNVLNGYGINVDGPFVPYEGPVTRDPNYASPTLMHVYNVGSIGWNSTGPHLDLKQVDNPNTPDVDETGAYYKYDDPEIREYIFVDDKELGMVPLSDVPMTGSWESHTSRGSNGYDYGIHDGRGIYIKPPARVVNSFRTSQNDDLLIIELPSGRRFKCHHGRRVND
jgi:hypothetical protein